MISLKDIFKKINRYEIEIRKSVNSHLAGDHYSVFKGQGLEFDDVRAYQYGDDVRTINWNVSAKGHGVYVKTFKEEKEQFVYFIFDMSASQEIGSSNRRKLDLGKELLGVLALAAAKQSSQVGLIAYSSVREIYIKPDMGEKHVYNLIGTLFKHEPVDKHTNLDKAITFALSIIKRKSIVILISDFIDKDYEKHFTALSRKHDLIAMHVADFQETRLPKLGIIPVVDKESGKTQWLNSSSGKLAGKLNGQFKAIEENLSQICHRYQADYVQVYTDDDIVPILIKLFNKRNRTMKRN